ncbi:MAG TPA: tetratricopeptide repeat protein, partial [Bacteroidales bacterium]|nr:tetratricopeptide repeat protein [Bacteroidales bacterium]
MTLLSVLLITLPLTFRGKLQNDSSNPFDTARRYDSLSMPDSALMWLEKVDLKRLDTSRLVQFYLLKGSVLRQLNFTDRAWQVYDSVKNLISSYSNSQAFEAEMIFLKGRLLNDRASYTDALICFESAQKMIMQKSPVDTSLLIRVLNFTGISHFYLGDFSAALNTYYAANQLASEKQSVNLLDYADIIQNIAITYSQLSQFDSAYIYINRSRALKESALRKDDPVLISFYVNYGRFLQMTGRITESMIYFNRADSLLRGRSGQEFIAGSLHINIGNTFQLTGDYDRAIQYFQSAYGYLSQSQGPSHPSTMSALNNIAFMYNRIGQHDSAIAILNRLRE